MFQIFFSNQAVKDAKRAEPWLRERLQKLVEILKETPVPHALFDLRKLEGEDYAYRIRLSSYRVQYHVSWDEKKIRIASIERRDENTYK